MKKIAVFDVDGTIFRSSLFIALVEELEKRGAFDMNVAKEFEREHRRWLDRKGTYEEYIDAVVASFMKHLKGVALSDFTAGSEAVFEEHKDRVYTYTRDLIVTLRKKGYFLLAISQSPKGVLDKFCKRLGFHAVYGRFYETGASEHFTGSVVDLHLIANKANIVSRAVKKHRLTLHGSIGVGDTEGDIPFLEMVQTPICFNPNKALYRHARRNKWRIVVERKDVVYTL